MSGKSTRALLLTPLIGLGACSGVGTLSIENGRTPYNEVIQATSEQQTLLNLVRVHEGETPLFVDVTEVDAQTSAQAGISGGPTLLGALGTSGAVTLSGQYLEQPTVRYQPLLGNALVAQVSTPVTAESIVNLYNSEWPLGSIFDLTVTRFTPAFDDYHGALDALATLDRYGALVLEAKLPAKPQSRSRDPLAALAASPAKGDADLLIHFQPSGFRTRFGPCDDGTRASDLMEVDPSRNDVSIVARHLWLRVQDLLHQHSDPVVLTVKSGPASSGRDGPPRLQTRSALGMLKDATEGDNLVTFGSQEEVDDIIEKTRQANEAADQNARTRHRDDASALNVQCHASFYRAGDLKDWNNRRFTNVAGAKASVLSPGDRNAETQFGNDRRLILVRITTQRPADAFAPVFHRGRWYSLRDDDLISKRNLALVSQIDTIQAVAPQTQPLTPAIVVSGR